MGHKMYDAKILSSGQVLLNAETIKKVTIATLRMLRTTVTAAMKLGWSCARHWDVGQESCRWDQPLSLKGVSLKQDVLPQILTVSLCPSPLGLSGVGWELCPVGSAQGR